MIMDISGCTLQDLENLAEYFKNKNYEVDLLIDKAILHVKIKKEEEK